MKLFTVPQEIARTVLNQFIHAAQLLSRENKAGFFFVKKCFVKIHLRPNSGVGRKTAAYKKDKCFCCAMQYSA